MALLATQFGCAKSATSVHPVVTSVEILGGLVGREGIVSSASRAPTFVVAGYVDKDNFRITTAVVDCDASVTGVRTRSAVFEIADYMLSWPCERGAVSADGSSSVAVAWHDERACPVICQLQVPALSSSFALCDEFALANLNDASMSVEEDGVTVCAVFSTVGMPGGETSQVVREIQLTLDGRVAARAANAQSMPRAATGRVLFSRDGGCFVFESDRDVDGATPVGKDANTQVWELNLDGRAKLLTRGIDGAPGNGNSTLRSLSLDGRFVLISSEAPRLIAEDGNRQLDVFVIDRREGTLRAACTDPSGRTIETSLIPDPRPSMSEDGRFVLMRAARSLARKDGPESDGLFLSDTHTRAFVCIDDALGLDADKEYVRDGVISGDGRVVCVETEEVDAAGPTRHIRAASARELMSWGHSQSK